MGSRVRSSLADGDSMLVAERVSGAKLRETPHHRNGLRRTCFKRKLLSLPPQKRETARQSSLKRSPLKRESKGRKAEVAKYNASAPAFFAEPGNDVCHICLRLREDGDNIILRPATERHHVRGRIGRLLNWRPGQMPSCRGHRLWPHDHPARARKLGLLCEAKDWNVYPDEGNITKMSGRFCLLVCLLDVLIVGMSDQIEIKHDGITITYRPKDNRWAFELRGRQRSAESLEKAKEAIDKPVNEKEEKPFQRIPIYIEGKYGNSGNYDRAEVTSVAESSMGSLKYVWVSRGKERSKEAVIYCYPINERNTALVQEISALQKQIDDLKKHQSNKKQKLQQVEV